MLLGSCQLLHIVGQLHIVGVAFALIGVLELCKDCSCDLPALHVFVPFENELGGDRSHGEFPIAGPLFGERFSDLCAWCRAGEPCLVQLSWSARTSPSRSMGTIPATKSW